MIISQTMILSQLKSNPNGCTIDELIGTLDLPYWERVSLRQNYRNKLGKLYSRGYIDRTGEGKRGSPFVWRVRE